MATDFFQQQDVAKQRTGLLIAYFALAVVLTTLAVYAALTAILLYVVADRPSAGLWWDWERLAGVVAVVALVIVSGTFYKLLLLREGGASIARLLGGQVVNPGVATPAQRRLLNVVEEMAIASGTPVPTVYILPAERSINAFAAGYEPGDAVIAVSQGSLDHLSRDELQGVVAHEFSHILHGDMRLNLRLIGLLHGILLLALIGRLILRIMTDRPGSSRSRSSKDDKKSGGLGIALFLLALSLIVIGAIGNFFGRLIKAAISRQREFLADASAVQFTRNPEGIAGALKKIGGLEYGSTIRNGNAEQASHMYFGPGVSFWTEALATHPPLAERIRRIDPSFNGTFPKIAASQVEPVREDEERRAHAAGLAAGFGPRQERRVELDPHAAVATVAAPGPEHVAYATALLASLPAPLASAAHEPFGACALVYALLLDRDPRVRQKQLALVDYLAAPGTAAEVGRLAPQVDTLDEAARLPLADLALPALRELSERQYQDFRAAIEPLIQADRQVSLFEYALQRMLLRHLDHHFTSAPPAVVRFRSLAPLRDDCAALLSTLARLGHGDAAAALHAFQSGVAALGLPQGGLTLLEPESSSLAALDRALDRIARAAVPVKTRVLEACAGCIGADGRVSTAEGELLRAIADSLDLPMPPLLEPAAPAIADPTGASRPTLASS